MSGSGFLRSSKRLDFSSYLLKQLQGETLFRRRKKPHFPKKPLKQASQAWTGNRRRDAEM